MAQTAAGVGSQNKTDRKLNINIKPINPKCAAPSSRRKRPPFLKPRQPPARTPPTSLVPLRASRSASTIGRAFRARSKPPLARHCALLPSPPCNGLRRFFECVAVFSFLPSGWTSVQSCRPKKATPPHRSRKKSRKSSGALPETPVVPAECGIVRTWIGRCC